MSEKLLDFFGFRSFE